MLNTPLELYEWRLEFSEFINVPSLVSGVLLRDDPTNLKQKIFIPIINKEVLSINLINGVIQTNDDYMFILSGPGKKITSNVYLTFEELQKYIISLDGPQCEEPQPCDHYEA